MLNLFSTPALLLKDHPQLEVIIDILSRKENYHVQITRAFSNRLNKALLKTIASKITTDYLPKSLRDIDFVYSDSYFSPDKRTILATSVMPHDDMLRNEKLRIIFFSNHKQANNFFVTLKLIEPNDRQLLSLLKEEKTELENFHHVFIPEETYASALSMAKHYLPSQSHFDKAYELLDSASARVSAIERNDSNPPNVSLDSLFQVISNWTQIPVTHLHSNSFQANKFIEALQKRIFGQEAAVTSMGAVLQHAYLKLQEKSGPLCGFLLVGLPETGKTTAAMTMAEHLFGHQGALIRINLSDHYQSLSDIKIISEENHVSLLTAIQQTPYAILLIENIHQASSATLALFKQIFIHGVVFENGQQYDFRHAIVIITTTLGSDRITAILESPSGQETNKTLDLMQLVLNENPTSNSASNPNLSMQDICENLIPTLEGYFSANLLQHLTIIPFIPLDYSALEKIIRLKIKLLAKRLDSHFGIELIQPPEVIKFLAHEAFWRKAQTKSLDKLLEQHLYSPVANEILLYADDKNRPKRLLLKLNEDGQLIRCEFMGTNLYTPHL